MSPHPLGVDFKMPLIVHNPSNHEFIISRNPSGWSDSISLQYICSIREIKSMGRSPHLTDGDCGKRSGSQRLEIRVYGDNCRPRIGGYPGVAKIWGVPTDNNAFAPKC